MPSAPTPDIDHLIVEHLPLVGHQVRATLSRVPAHVPRDDLVSAGQLALVLAARSWRPESGVPFHAWARLRIRGAMLDELRRMDWVSRAARNRINRVSDATEELAAHLGRVPTAAEVAEATGMTEDQVTGARHDNEVATWSLNAFEDALADTIVDAGARPEDGVLSKELLHHMRAALAALPERLRFVVTATYLHDRPLPDVADELGVTTSRVSQMRSEALNLMKDGMNAALDPDLVGPAARPGGVAHRRRKEYMAKVAALAASRGAAAAALPLVRDGAQAEPDVLRWAA